MSNLQEIFKEFVVETEENLDQINKDLVALEKDPSAASTVASIFRAMHTIKGNSGMLGFSKLEKVAHAGETLLSKVHDSIYTLDQTMTDALLEMSDAIREILGCVETTFLDGDEEYPDLVERLSQLAQTGKCDSSAPSKGQEAKPEEGPAEAAVAEKSKEEPVATSASTGNLQEILKEFIIETEENLDQIDKDIVGLEKDPSETSTVASIFRAIHTIKGNSGLLGFSKLEKIAHVGETLLSKVRDGIYTLDQTMTDALLEMSDAIREILACVESTYLDGDKEYPDLVERLGQLAQTGKCKTPVPSKSEKATPKKESTTAESEIAKEPEEEPLANSQESQAPEEQVEEVSKKEVAAPQKAAEAATGKAKDTPTEAKSSVTDSTIRVDVGLLDSLVNLVGELVLTRNQVIQVGQQINDSGFSAALQRLSLVTTELQEGIMQTRMQPVGNAWSKLPRLVRDLCHSCGKQVRLVQEGRETELDKSLIEAIRDPLTHMVRNAIDHGIESPEERTEKGKPPIGEVLLRAYHEGGQVIIDISDDGQGINTERVVAKALATGVITAEQQAGMTPRDILDLIFLPGISTAQQVTNVSGRGVGMDIVKNNIEKIGGTVEIKSEVGLGSSFRIHIPLTLAIIPALIISCEQQRYAIPQLCLVELVRLEKEQFLSKVETVGGTSVYRLRGKLLPLTYMSSVFYAGTEGSQDEREGITIVVLQANERQFGLVVDTVEDNQEIVVKPLGRLLYDTNVYAGATILGDGSVALILDVGNLAALTGIDTKVSQAHQRDMQTNVNEAGEQAQQLLICKSPDNALCGIMLSEITRLERIMVRSIEVMGHALVTQYRGSIIKLVDLGLAFGGMSSVPELKKNSESVIDVVIYETGGETVGLIVEHIVDVVDAFLAVQQPSNRKGVAFNAAVDDRIVEILDIGQLYTLAG